MRLTILASLVGGLIAGLLGGLIVVLVLDDGDAVAREDLAALEARLEALDEAQQRTAADRAAREDIQGLLDQVRPAVVLITTEVPLGDGESAGSRGAIGTGVVLDDQGHVLTNEHVVRNAVSIELRFSDGSTRSAVIVGDDGPFTDLAVLRIDPEALTPAPFATSADLRLGDSVFTFGNALGNDAALTRGVVSNPSARFFDADSNRQDYIQTDAAVNPGNSGGPLLSAAGEVVGLVTRVVTSTADGQAVQGVGFALATDRIMPIAERIIEEGGDYPRPDFGVVEQRSLDDLFAEQIGAPVIEGALIVELLRTSTFADAGIRPGDIIRSLNGFDVTEETPYFHVLLQLLPGRPVDVIYIDQAGEEHLVEIVPVLRRR